MDLPGPAIGSARNPCACDAPDFHLLDRQGFVKITSTSGGTQIEWSVFAPNWASLYFAMEWLHTFPGPYTLRYYLSGWFDEKYNDVNAARNRIDIIIGKSDIHLTRHTFVTEVDPYRANIPDILKTALNEGEVNPNFGVDCVLDEIPASSMSSASGRSRKSPGCGA